MGKAEVLSTVRKSLVTAAFMLFACLSAMADGVSKEITLTEAGTLSTAVGDAKNTITSLTVSGPINGADILCLREMAGRNVNGDYTEGKLAELDLTNAIIVASDDIYYNDGSSCKTENNVVGEYAFYRCSQLKSVKLPNTVTGIGTSAFWLCDNLKSVIIPNSVTSIGDKAFWNCSALTSVTIPDSVTSIGDEAFYGCTNLATVTIPNSVTSIGDAAFYGSSLSSVTIGSGVKSIGDLAFASCQLLSTIEVKDGNTFYHVVDNCLIEIASNILIRGCRTDSITIPNSVTSIGGYAFDGCISLKNIIIPDAVTSIGDNAFRGCYNLTSVTIPNSVTSIGKRAFSYCEGLSSVTIPNSVTSIGETAFWFCTKLSSVTIGSGVTSIGVGAFYDCSSLSEIVVEDANTYYHVDGNCLIETASKTLIKGCTVESIVIPNSVTSIGDAAFKGCSNLTSVTIPNSVTSIGKMAFSYCSGLSSVTIPNSVDSIGETAFSGCSNLISVTIPKSVTSIGMAAFADCTNLKEVTLLGDKLPNCETYAFGNISSDATLYCNASLIETIKNVSPWSDFAKKVEIESSNVITLTDAGIATACFDKDLDLTSLGDTVKAYIASGFSPSGGTVLLTRVTHIPAGTGFVVKGAAGTYDIPMAETDYMYVNMLEGTLVSKSLSKTEGSYTNYVLGNGDKGVGFYLPGDDFTIDANKAYLQIPTSTEVAMRSIGISFEDEDGTTTGFISVKELKEDVSGTSAVYDINGQRKSGLSKGLNIVDGKKIYIR